MNTHPSKITTRYDHSTFISSKSWVEELGESLLGYYNRYGFVEDSFYGTLSPDLKEKIISHLNKQEVQ